MGKRIISAVIIMTLLISMTAACSKKNEEVVGGDAEEESVELVVIDINLTDEDYGIGVNKNKPEILEKINEFIEAGFENGKYDEITGHYFGGTGDPVGIPTGTRDDEKDQLVVATTGDFEPFDYDEGDLHYGIDMELIKAIADYMGKELVLVNVNFDIMFQTVAQGKCDACIAGITIKDERKEFVDFSVPYFNAGQCLVANKADNDFKDAKTREEAEEILKNLDESVVIAVEAETTGESYLQGEAGDFPGVKCKIMKCSTLADCIIALHNGNADYVIGDNATLKYLVANQ
ncbi:transporter substrate-binding domain-containing protein [Butyrivibrio sp. FC2001]|uniref:transporter substrate-binding domain-containing protein n=1 Tax=Butyrivibrio sp. FC2001 TaxID=1280671 RepID=UPI0004250C85|nr:transporter substrate-binding domain-containing protein [Butyrivibrio sp. FC2001]